MCDRTRPKNHHWFPFILPELYGNNNMNRYICLIISSNLSNRWDYVAKLYVGQIGWNNRIKLISKLSNWCNNSTVSEKQSVTFVSNLFREKMRFELSLFDIRLQSDFIAQLKYSSSNGQLLSVQQMVSYHIIICTLALSKVYDYLLISLMWNLTHWKKIYMTYNDH